MPIEEYFDIPVITKIETEQFHDSERFYSKLVKKDYTVAIWGIEEGINSLNNQGCEKAPNCIREQLYALQGDFKRLKICDLGNIKKGQSVKDTYCAVKDIVSELAEKNIISIILGGSQELTLPIFEGIQSHQASLNISVIDNKIDLGKGDGDFNSYSYLSNIIKNKHLRRLELIAYQSYFVPESQLNFLKEHNQYGIRLGAVRRNIGQTEPLLRDTDMVSFDMRAIRQGDSPASGYANPNGLTGEEACQLSLFAGYSDRIKATGLFEFNPNLDRNSQSAGLAAQMIWYFLEGLNNRQKDYPIAHISSYQKYVIQQDQLDEDIIFYHNPNNNRWWIEIPNISGNKEIYSCNTQEYEEARQGKIPNSWLKYYKK
jgi:arginase family enzyme